LKICRWVNFEIAVWIKGALLLERIFARQSLGLRQPSDIPPSA
jgi:hypothetical protein